MDVTYIVLGIITIISGLAVKYAIPYFKVKVGKDNWDLLMVWAKVFVEAAEVVITGVDVGCVKREKVLSDLRRKCDELGIKYSEEDIRSALENAWAEMSKEVAKNPNLKSIYRV